MALPRRSRARPSGTAAALARSAAALARSAAALARSAAALARLAAVPAGARRGPSPDHPTPAAGGISFFRLCLLMRVAATAVPPAFACPLSGGAAVRQTNARRLS